MKGGEEQSVEVILASVASIIESKFGKNREESPISQEGRKKRSSEKRLALRLSPASRFVYRW